TVVVDVAHPVAVAVAADGGNRARAGIEDQDLVARLVEEHRGREPEAARPVGERGRSEEHTSELQSLRHLVCRLLLEKKKKQTNKNIVFRLLLEKKKKKTNKISNTSQQSTK